MKKKTDENSPPVCPTRHNDVIQILLSLPSFKEQPENIPVKTLHIILDSSDD